MKYKLSKMTGKTFVALLMTVYVFNSVFAHAADAFGIGTAGSNDRTKVSEDFEDYPNTAYSGFVSQFMPVTDPSEVINGSASGIIDVSDDHGAGDYINQMWQIGYRMEPYQTYTLTFKYKIIRQGPYSRFYMLARSDVQDFWGDRYVYFDNSPEPLDRSDSGDWYNFNIINRGDYKVMRFNFTNDDATDRYLMWGVNGGGRIAIDDVRLETGTGPVYPESLSPIAQEPAKPMVTQDFDNTFTGIKNMRMAANGQAVLTNEHDEVINGISSLKGTGGAEWTFAETAAEKIPLIAWDIHTVTFKMKKTGNLSPGGFYHFTAMTPTGRGANGFDNDRYFRWNDAGEIIEAGTGSFAYLEQLRCFIRDEGDHWFVKFTFYIDGYTDYALQWGINSGAEGNSMIIDDVRVYYGKDYTPDISVAKAEPMPVKAVTFENTSLGGFINHQGVLSFRNPDIVNGSYSLKASTAAGTEWQQILSSDPAGFALVPNANYTVTFRLKDPVPTDGYYQFSIDNDTHDQDSVIRIKGDGSDAGSFNTGGYSFKEEVNGTYRVTAHFRTGSHTDYRWSAMIYNGGAFAIDDIYFYEGSFAGSPSPVEINELEAAAVLTERFENQDLGQWFFNVYGGSIAYKADDVINGSYSYNSKFRGTDDYYFSMESKPDALALKPDTAYTVTYRYKTTAATGEAGSFMFAARTESGGYLNDKFIRYTDNGEVVPGVGSNVDEFSVTHHEGYSDVVVRFTTGSYSDYKIAFITYLSGDRIIDDINVFEGIIYAQDPQPVKDIIEIVPVYSEHFAEADPNSSIFLLNSGKYMWEEGDIINGSYSYALIPEPDEYGYTISMVSNRDKTSFTAGKTYTVTLRWYALSEQAEGENIILAFRGEGGDKYVKFDTAGVMSEGNSRYFEVADNGKYIDMAVTFTLGSAENYELAMICQGSPEIVVDDFVIYEGFIFNENIPVEVEPKDITPVFTERFENVSGSGSSFIVNNGTYVFRESDVINGSFSFYAKGNAGDNWIRSVVTDQNKARFDAKGTYTVTLRYRNALQNADGSFFQIGVRTDEGGPVNDAYVRFDSEGARIAGNDVSYLNETEGDSEDIRMLTVTFTLKDFNDYQFAIVLYDECSMILDDIRVFRGAIASEDDETNYEASDPAFYADEDFENYEENVFAIYSGTYVTKDPDVISGKASFRINTCPDEGGWTSAAESIPEKLSFAADGTYTISFRYQITENTDENGYFMAAMRTDKGTPINDQYLRFNADDDHIEGNDVSASVYKSDDHNVMNITFKLRNFDDYKLCFYIYGGSGKLVMDDIAIYEGIVYPDKVEAVSSPVSDVQALEKLRYTEDFELAGADGASFISRQGRFLFDRESIINGSFSYAVAGIAPGTWADGIVSSADKITLLPEQTYTAVFRYRVIESTGPEGFMQFSARIPGSDGLSDKYARFRSDGSYVEGNASYDVEYCNEGDFYTVIIIFTLGDFSNYELTLSAYDSGVIAVDDIRIFESAFRAEDNSQLIVNVPAVFPAPTAYSIPERLPDFLKGYDGPSSSADSYKKSVGFYNWDQVTNAYEDNLDETSVVSGGEADSDDEGDKGNFIRTAMIAVAVVLTASAAVFAAILIRRRKSA